MLIGAFTGIAAGLLGIGGGLIIVPFSLLVFEHLNQFNAVIIPVEQQAHIAIATSLATIIFTSLSAIYSQQKKQAIYWSIFWLMMPGIVLGAFMGAWIASFVTRAVLIGFFASFLLLVAVKMWVGWSPHSQRQLPGWFGMNLVAVIIGNISALVGIGGGTMTVPFLNWGKIKIQNAVAVSSALGLPIAISGSLGFIFSSMHHEVGMDEPLLLGYIYLPAFFAIISTSIFTAKWGVLLSHRLSKQHLSRVFSILLLLLVCRLYYTALWG
jgi:uncharacterized membrane protein YfcA